MEKEQITTPEFRVAFEHIKEPVMKPGKDGTEYGVYSLTMLYDKKTDISPLKSLLEHAIEDEWGSKPPSGLKYPIKDGDEKTYEGYPGCSYATCSSYSLVGIATPEGDAMVDMSEFYQGCYARAILTAKVWHYTAPGTNMKSKGVKFWLQALQKIRDGAPIHTRIKAEDAFSPIAVADEDGTAELENELNI